MQKRALFTPKKKKKKRIFGSAWRRSPNYETPFSSHHQLSGEMTMMMMGEGEGDELNGWPPPTRPTILLGGAPFVGWGVGVGVQKGKS